VFAERGALEPDTDMANVQVVLPAPAVNDSWPQSGGFANYAMHNLAVGDSPQIIWTADVGAGTSSSRILTTPPIVAEGKVFAKDAQGTVSAFNADSGQLLWRVTLKPEKARDSDEFGGGLAYYGGRLFVTTGFATVYSLDPANGTEVWNSTVSAPVRGSPLVFADRVFVISIDNKLQTLAAVDGRDLWQYSALQEAAGFVTGNSPAGSGDYVVAPFSSGESWRWARRVSLRQLTSTAASACGSAASAAARHRGPPVPSCSSPPAPPTSQRSAATMER
jgi:outer membrane protein assembly factor BamB